MGFFNDLGKKTTEATSKITKETKLKLKMNENKGKISDLYEEIGKKVYEKHIREENINIKGLYYDIAIASYIINPTNNKLKIELLESIQR